MPANIATIAGKPAIMYTGEVPWHKLGTPLKAPATAVEAVRAASLDWDVFKAPLHIKPGRRYEVVADHFAMVRADQKVPHVLGIVGKNYTRCKIVRHSTGSIPLSGKTPQFITRRARWTMAGRFGFWPNSLAIFAWLAMTSPTSIYS
jgi:hypothetical protein